MMGMTKQCKSKADEKVVREIAEMIRIRPNKIGVCWGASLLTSTIKKCRKMLFQAGYYVDHDAPWEIYAKEQFRLNLEVLEDVPDNL